MSEISSSFLSVLSGSSVVKSFFSSPFSVTPVALRVSIPQERAKEIRIVVVRALVRGAGRLQVNRLRDIDGEGEQLGADRAVVGLSHQLVGVTTRPVGHVDERFDRSGPVRLEQAADEVLPCIEGVVAVAVGEQMQTRPQLDDVELITTVNNRGRVGVDAKIVRAGVAAAARAGSSRGAGVSWSCRSATPSR